MSCPPRLIVAGHAEGRPVSTGTVRSFDSTKGYGFIRPDDGSRDVFVPASVVEQAGMEPLRAEQRITYILRHDPKARKNAASELRAA
jgi:CspA family cold shock protein